MKIESRKNVQFNEFHGITLDWKVIRLNKIKHLIHIVENFIFKRLQKCKILIPYKNSRVHKARVGLKLFTTLLAYKQVFFFGAGFFEIVRGTFVELHEETTSSMIPLENSAKDRNKRVTYKINNFHAVSTPCNTSSDSNKPVNQVHWICNEPWLTPIRTGYFFFYYRPEPGFCRQYTSVRRAHLQFRS